MWAGEKMVDERPWGVTKVKTIKMTCAGAGMKGKVLRKEDVMLWVRGEVRGKDVRV